MRTKNNLFDEVEKVSDGKLYAVNIRLKSGEVVHLEHLEKGEKDAYVNYVRSGRDKMLIETTKQVWRILPDDIERLDVKAYNSGQANSVYPFMRFLMTHSRMSTVTFTNFIMYFILLFIFSIAFQVIIGVISETPGVILFDFSLLAPYVARAKNIFIQFSWLLIAIMFILNIIDLILSPKEKFYILDEDRSVLADTKLMHLLITLGCLIGFLFIGSFAFNLIAGILSF